VKSSKKLEIARVAPFDIDTAGFTDVEQGTVHDHRWWTPEELRHTDDVLTPRQLPLLLQQLLDDGTPPVPITVPV